MYKLEALQYIYFAVKTTPVCAGYAYGNYMLQTNLPMIAMY